MELIVHCLDLERKASNRVSCLHSRCRMWWYCKSVQWVDAIDWHHGSVPVWNRNCRILLFDLDHKCLKVLFLVDVNSLGKVSKRFPSTTCKCLFVVGKAFFGESSHCSMPSHMKSARWRQFPLKPSTFSVPNWQCKMEQGEPDFCTWRVCVSFSGRLNYWIFMFSHSWWMHVQCEM
jgi:hypothetical protein